MNKFDKPYRILPTVDIKKGLELFNLASRLDTHEMLQFSLINQTPFDIEDLNGDSLINEVIRIDPRKATQHAKLHVIKFLVQNGVNPDKPNKYNKTALHVACSLQLDLIVKYLLECGVNSNYQDNLGLTPFHYLLSGDIKLEDNTSDVLDFVPPPKKVAIDKKEEILAIKQQLWTLIGSIQNSDNLPMLETIKKTINSILNEDIEIQNRQLDLIAFIARMGASTEAKDISPDTKQQIKAIQKAISDKINKLFGLSTNIKNNFDVHTKEPDSWPLTYSDKFSFIKKGNIKKVIKKDMEDTYGSIVKLNNDFKPIDNVPSTYQDNGFREMIIDYIIQKFQSNNIIIPNTNQYRYNAQFTPDMYTDTNNQIRHKNALDNASDIIDFDNLTFASGPRVVTINRPLPDIRLEIQDLLAMVSDDKRILHLLGSPISLATIIGLPGNDYDLVADFGNFGGRFNPDITNLGQLGWYTSAVAIDPMDRRNMREYIYLAYTAIQYPEKMDDLNTLVDGIGATPFFTKWYEIYTNGSNNFNLGAWIYGMWCDLMCKTSDTNLECEIPFRLLMLIAGLGNNNNSQNKVKNVYNAYKPHLYQYIIAGGNNSVQITKWILLLLNDNIDVAFLNIIFANHNDDTFINGLGLIPDNLKNIGHLIYNYINSRAYDFTSVNSINNYYKSFKVGNLKPDDVLCKILLSYYDNLQSKPLKQTMVDTIYFIRETFITNPQLNNFNLISIFNILLVPNENQNKQPSLYGEINYQLDNDDNDTFADKIEIAHLLGLYYEGIVDFTEYNLTQPINYIVSRRDSELYLTSLVGAQAHTINNMLNPPLLDQNQLPIPLNYLILGAGINMPYLMKYDYYETEPDNIIIPSYHSYLMLLIKRINSYQQKIKDELATVNIIISELLIGKTTRLRELYTEIYPRIVCYYELLDRFINSLDNLDNLYKNDTVYKDSELRKRLPMKTTDISKYSFNKLAESLNSINSNYYLYYYLFSPDKLINLSRFNYYQIPDKDPLPYVYYSDPTLNNDMANILNETDIQPNGLAANTPISTSINPESNDKNGLINQFNLGHYNSMLDNYSKLRLPTNPVLYPNYFLELKSSKLPPSLKASLEKFYNYAAIELVKKIIDYINSNKTVLTQPIYSAIIALINKSNISIESDNNDMTAYKVLCELIAELIDEQTKVNINNLPIYIKSNLRKYKSFIC